MYPNAACVCVCARACVCVCVYTQHLFDLEAALTEHHKLLIDMGHALPLDPPPVPKELLPRTATGELIPLPDRPTAQTSEVRVWTHTHTHIWHVHVCMA